MKAIDKDGNVISTSPDGVTWTERSSSADIAAIVVSEGPPGDPIGRLVGGGYKTLHGFRRAFPGWECDSEGWIVERVDSGERFVIVTDHGGHRLGDVSTLLRDIERYEELIAGARKAIGILDGR